MYSHPDLALLLKEAEAGASRLARCLRLQPADRADVSQDLLLELITRMPGYAPVRGAPGAFAGIVIRHKAGRLARRIIQDRARPSVCLDDITSAPEAQPPELSDRPFDGVELRLDVRRALQRLDPPDRELCSELIDRSASEIERSAPQRSRATLYRQIRDIRLRLMLDGVSANG